MTILGIKNRTENWKTARHFSPLFGEARVCLARKLGEPRDTQSGEVHLELYWKGMRDYLHMKKTQIAGEDFAVRYNRLFRNLRKEIEDFRIGDSYGFQRLNNWNYDVSTKDCMDKLKNNLINTEIDIVLQSPSYLYIGEAKHEMSFGANGSLVLVHQLIRQYVMARILVDLLGCSKRVTPFIVGDDAEALGKSHQVRFMICQGWMKKENVLEWGKVKELTCDYGGKLW